MPEAASVDTAIPMNINNPRRTTTGRDERSRAFVDTIVFLPDS